MATAASITRQIKKIVDDAETSVTTRYVHNGSGGHPLWQSFVFVEQHKHDALIAKLAAEGLDNVSRSTDFLSVCQAAD